MRDLLKLYSFYSVSGTKGEKDICDWIAKYLKSIKVPYKRLNNTLYHFTKDSKVMLSAHLDQVETQGPAVHFFKNKGTITAYNKDWEQTSLGADDKNGVWIILKLLAKGYKFDFVISESEETGGAGIKSVESFISSSGAGYCLVLDRKGNFDILNKGSGCTYCEALAYNLKNFWKHDYTITTGSISDTQTISKYKESVNMSVAYSYPHSYREETDFDRLQVILADVEKVVKGDFIHYPADPVVIPVTVKKDYDYDRTLFYY